MLLYKPFQAVHITILYIFRSLATLPLPSRQVNMPENELIFQVFGRHHSKSRIFERMDNFQNNYCHPWAKKFLQQLVLKAIKNHKRSCYLIAG